MPIYEFACDQCGARFEELVAGGTERAACAQCGSAGARRVLSAVSPPGRGPSRRWRRESDSRRREREAARRERIAEARKKRTS